MSVGHQLESGEEGAGDADVGVVGEVAGRPRDHVLEVDHRGVLGGGGCKRG